MEKIVKPSTIKGRIDAPASKSYAQRALAIGALTSGVNIIRGVDSGGDIDAVINLVADMGCSIEIDNHCVTLSGGVYENMKDALFIGESGLATRLFTPIASLFDKKITITGHGSILTRPIESMRQPLEDLGVKFSSSNGFLPLSVEGKVRGGSIEVDGSLSSQFISGLLIALPLCEADSTLRVANLKSKPYIDMTLDTIKMAGVEITHEDYKIFNIKGGQSYKSFDYRVEGDWSGASCLLVGAATAGEITIDNLNLLSSQADRALTVALESAGAVVEYGEGFITVKKSQLSAFTFDATDCPDLFPALAALAASCSGVSTIKGTLRLTHKESDRAKTIKELLARVGISADISQEDVMIIHGGNIIGGVSVDSCNDHRIAMAAAILALKASDSITIERAEAVGKSYKNFWDDLCSVVV